MSRGTRECPGDIRMSKRLTYVWGLNAGVVSEGLNGGVRE